MGKRREYPGNNRYIRQGLPQQNSSSPGNKRKDGQIGLHEIKKLLHNQRNGLYTEENVQGVQKTKLPPN
jgi:hypothetical protein